MLIILLLVILVVLCFGAFPSWPYSRRWGYGPSSGLIVLIVILIVLYLLGII